MPVTIDLTPPEILIEDFEAVQTPAIGGEKDVLATVSPFRLLGLITMAGDGVVSYKFTNEPTASPGPIVAVVMGAGMRANAAPVVSYAGLSGTFKPVGWSGETNNFNFGATRGVELVGNFVAPGNSGVPTVTNAKKGSKLALLELPPLADFTFVGCTNDKRIKYPTKKSKAIACQLESSRWTKGGATEVGELSVTSIDLGPDTGLRRIAGMKAVAMIESRSEERVLRERIILTGWTPAIDDEAGEGETESKVNGTGMFSYAISLPAPGEND
jgi:hypothetical protein